MMNNTFNTSRPHRRKSGHPVALATTHSCLYRQDRARQVLLQKIALTTLLTALVFSCLLAAAPVQAGSLGFTATSIQPQEEDDC
jgi:hypothetical protein